MKKLFRSLSLALLVALAFSLTSVYAIFDNGGFESGSFTSWSKSTFLNPGLSGSAPFSGTSIVRNTGGSDVSYIRGPFTALSQTDPIVPAIKFPRYGNYSAVVNFNTTGQNANALTQTDKVEASDIDSADGKIHIRFAYAPIMADPGHSAAEQPYFYIGVTNATKGGIVLYETFAYANQPGVPWSTYVNGDTYTYTDWQVVDIAPKATQIAVGDEIKIEVIAAGCSQGGHAGWVYLDAFGSEIPGISVVASAPELVNAGNQMTYTYTYRNKGAYAVANTQVQAVLPTNVTYVSVSDTTNCTGGSTVSCNFGTLAVNQVGTFQVTVNVPTGTTGTIDHGNYSIWGTDEPSLLGPMVSTEITAAPLVDLGVTISDGITSLIKNTATTYTITVTNPSSTAITGATLTDSVPGVFNNVSWTCSGTNGATCPATGSGSINASVDLPASSSVTFLLTGTLSLSASGSVTNAVSVALPAGYTDPYTDNDAASDTDTIPPSYAPNAWSAQTPPDGTYGSPYTYTFAANGDPAATYAVVSGTLPPGLSLNSTTGELSGTPSAAGDFSNIVIQASNYVGVYSTSTFDISISRAGTSISINSISPAATVYGQDYTIAVAVNPVTAGVPSGSVVVHDGDNGCVITLTAGAGSCTLHSLNAGSHTVSISYGGDSNFLSSSNSSSHLISPADTAIVLSTPYNPAPYGAPFRITATVASVAPGLATPYGKVQFYLNGEAFGSPVDLSGGSVQSELVPAPLGNYDFTAAYIGNANLNPSNTASTLAQVIEKAHTTTVVTTTANPTVYGNGVTFTAHISAVLPSIATPDGSVQFKLNGVNYGAPVVLDGSGHATKTIPFTALWPTNHAITAVYSGAGNFLASDNSSTPLSHTVIKATPLFSFVPSQTEALAGEPFSAVISVLPNPANIGTPSGQISILVDGVLFAGPLTLDSHGQVSIDNVALLTGGHNVSLQYAGDDYFAVTPSTFPLPVTISPADTTTTITGFTPADLVTGQLTAVSISVAPVAPAAGVPTGQVLVSNGADSCTATLTSGTGSCDLTPTHPGSPALSARYLGDASYNVSDAAALPGPSVVKADTFIATFTSNLASIVTGQPATLTVSVAPAAPGTGIPSGTVTITNAAGSCTVTLVNGSGSCVFVPGLAGLTNLTVSYSGDDDFNPVSESLAGPVVSKAPTELSIISSNTASVYGESVTFTATIAVPAPGAGSPTGLVQFYIDSQSYGDPVALEDDTAVSPVNSLLAVGSHSITADYLGDDNFAAASTSSLSQSVAAVNTSLVLFADVNPSPYGMPVFVTARLTTASPSTAIPSGSIQFYVDGVTYGSPVTVNASGEAVKELPWTALWVGHHSITAVFSGNTSFNAADNLSTPWDQEVIAGDVSFSALGSASPSVFGQPVSFTISVVRLGQSPILPTGTVNVLIDGAPFASDLTLDAAAQAVIAEIDSLAVGYHSITIAYSGDENYAAFTSTLTNVHQVTQSPVAVSIDSFTSAVVVGQPVDVTVSVAAAAPGAGTPSGSVIVTNGSKSCSITLSAGSGVCQFTPFSAGTFELSAVYSGDTSFLTGSDSASTGPVISAAQTQTTLVSFSPNPIVVGQPTIVSVSVAALAPGSGLPSGPVFVEFGTANCTAAVIDGVGSCQLTPNQTGLTSISISYLGSDDYQSSSAGMVSGPSVQKALTWTLVSGPTAALPSQSIQWTAQVVTLAPGSGTASGFIQFFLDEQPIGAPVAVVDGAAVSAPVTGLTPGEHIIHAFYMGSLDYENSHSSHTGVLVDKYSFFVPVVFNP